MNSNAAMTQRENANIARGGGFNEQKFISDLYACETIKKVLTDRIKKLKSDLDYLGHDKKDLRIPSFDQSAFRQDYNREAKQLQKYPQKPKEPFKRKVKIDKDDVIGGFLLSTFVSVIIYSILGFFIIGFIYDFFDGYMNPIGVIITILMILAPFIYVYFSSFWPKRKAKVEYKKKLEEYQFSMQKYNDNCKSVDENNAVIKANNTKLWQQKKAEYSEWVESEKAKYRTYSDEYERERAIKEYLLQQELNAAQNELSVVNKTLISLYALQINGVFCLHPTYQGLIPVSVIYGYFDTGRCSCLRGPGGAYNLYEDERIKGIIINQLGDIARGLRQLNASMRYVGDLLDRCERQLKTLNKNMETLIDETSRMNTNMNEAFFDINSNLSRNHQGISAQVGQIAENTANSAYYSEVGAKMSTMHTFYSICKDL